MDLGAAFRPPTVGLDIGSSAVKAVVLRRGRGGWSLVTAGALFVSGSDQALIEIARTEKDPELKKKAVSHLANMGSKEATAFLLEILNK